MTFGLGVTTSTEVGNNAGIGAHAEVVVGSPFSNASTPFNLVAGIVGALNGANQLHWIAGPFGLFGPSSRGPDSKANTSGLTSTQSPDSKTLC